MATEVAVSPAQELRERLVADLLAQGAITTDAVADAMRAVPREAFVPVGTDLAEVYAAHSAVVTKRGPDGSAMSSVSAAWLQARMLELARIGPGGRVLEVGSGGCNAAYVVEVVGADGVVVSVDIDADVVDRARAGLARTGHYVTVVLADGADGYAPHGPYDAIMVTVEASDIPPAWIDQLADGGVLVAPVRMRAHTRCVALERDGDHLVSTAALQCGFVSMQGDGSDPTRQLQLRGSDAVLTLDDPTTEVDGDALRAALDGPRVEGWSQVALTMDASFESLHLWLASQPRPYGILTVDRHRTTGLLDPQDRFFCPTLLTDDSFAYLAIRRLDEATWQCGAHGFGPDAATLIDDLNHLITAWDRLHRAGIRPAITVHPAAASLPDAGRLQLVVPRRHTQIVVTWPVDSTR